MNPTQTKLYYTAHIVAAAQGDAVALGYSAHICTKLLHVFA